MENVEILDSLDEEGVEYVKWLYQLDSPIRWVFRDTSKYKAVCTCPICGSIREYNRDYIWMCLHCDLILRINHTLIVYNQFVNFFNEHNIHKKIIVESFELLNLYRDSPGNSIKVVFKHMGIKEDIALKFVEDCNKKIGVCFGNENITNS